MSSSHERRRRLARSASSNEDQALNQIAHEAEARLSAKRAARAEARNIRMKELERQQKEAVEEIDKQHQIMNEDPTAKKKYIPGRSGSMGNLSREGDIEVNGPIINDRAMKSMQDSLHETEEKYRKAMISIAQLDNEKQALLYQVDCLKDRLAEEEEISTEIKVEFKDKTRECERLKRSLKQSEEDVTMLKEAVEIRDNFLAEKGLTLEDINSEAKEGEELSDTSSLRDAVSLAIPDDASSDKSSLSEHRSRPNSRRPSISDDKEVLVLQIRNLQEQVLSLKRAGIETPQTITADLEELRREFGRQINDFRLKLQKAEQENARLEGLVMRLESQVKRYKTSSETLEISEDNLKQEKRKLQRELRKAQEDVGELQTVNEHLQKRFDKLKNKRKDET